MHRMIFKYEEMLRLRRTAEPGGPDGDIAPREALRRLSEEFPGALRELDRLPIAEIERRLEALRAGAPDPVLVAIARYHASLRTALLQKRVDRTQVPGARLSQSVLIRVAEETRVPTDDLREALGLRRSKAS